METKAEPRRHSIVDAHAHVSVFEYLELLAGVDHVLRDASGAPILPSRSAPDGDDEASLERRMAMMDSAGVYRQIVSATLPPYVSNSEVAMRAAVTFNDRCADLSRSCCDRLAGLVTLPLPHINASLRELRRGLDDLGMVGVSMHAFCQGESIASDRFRPLFEEMDRRACTLFIHPCVNGLCSPLLSDWRLDACAGTLMEDVTIALHLMSKSVPVRFPNLRIIIPHLGGGLAGMLERLDNQMPRAVPGMAARPSDMARTFWYDTVSHGSTSALRSAIESFGAARLVPGSDYPYLLTCEPYSSTFDYVQSALQQDVAKMILANNAFTLLI
jgi:predicted TIM-barrel fold metal-dependent hydrolase